MNVADQLVILAGGVFRVAKLREEYYDSFREQEDLPRTYASRNLGLWAGIHEVSLFNPRSGKVPFHDEPGHSVEDHENDRPKTPTVPCNGSAFP
jgi:hypothetical protein